MIAIIDYDAGNLKSVEKALVHLEQSVIVTRDEQELLKADKVILPGVGSFADAMDKLKNYGLIDTIHTIVNQKIPLLGICLGMQLLFECSEEHGNTEGLSLLKGEILRIPVSEGLKIPHMGWNSLQPNKNSHLLEGIEGNPYVYFVHSYYLKAHNIDDVAAFADYGVQIHAAVERDNIFGCQFHPEKSGSVGLAILKNFAGLEKRGE